MDANQITNANSMNCLGFEKMCPLKNHIIIHTQLNCIYLLFIDIHLPQFNTCFFADDIILVEELREGGHKW